MTSAPYPGSQGSSYPDAYPDAYPESPGRSPAGPAPRRPREAGLPGVAAVALIVILSLLGAVFDLATGSGLRSGYGVTFVLGCGLAALLVQKSHRLWPVFAPPLVFAATAVAGAYQDNDRQFDRVRVGSDALLRMVAPDKAPWLLAAFTLAFFIAIFRYWRDR